MKDGSQFLIFLLIIAIVGIVNLVKFIKTAKAKGVDFGALFKNPSSDLPQNDTDEDVYVQSPADAVEFFKKMQHNRQDFSDETTASSQDYQSPFASVVPEVKVPEKISEPVCQLDEEDSETNVNYSELIRHYGGMSIVLREILDKPKGLQ